MTPEEAEDLREMLGFFPIQQHPNTLLQDAAFALASVTGRGIYDCLYLTLARFLGAPMVTADRKLYDALAGGPLARHLRWVEDIEDHATS